MKIWIFRIHFPGSPLHSFVRNVGETDPHGCRFPVVMDIFELDDAAAIPRPELVEGGVETFLLFVTPGHRIGNYRGKQFRGEIPFFTEAGEHHAERGLRRAIRRAVRDRYKEKSGRVSPSALFLQSDQPLRRWVLPAPAPASAGSLSGSECSSDSSPLSPDFLGERNSSSVT